MLDQYGTLDKYCILLVMQIFIYSISSIHRRFTFLR